MTMKRTLQAVALLGALLLLVVMTAYAAARQPGTPTPPPPTPVPTFSAQRVDHFPTVAWPKGKAVELRTVTPTPRPLDSPSTSRIWAFTCE